MSGFEVVGVVLGALPLAIEGAKAYKKLYKIAKDVPRGLRDLIRDLETEKIRLDVTCEHLLDGVAPQHEIRELMKTPFGIAWGPYRELIDIRLWGCLDTVQYRIQEMLKASLDLKEKLSTRRREKSWDAIGDIGSKLKTVFHSQSGNKMHHGVESVGLRDTVTFVFKWDDYGDSLKSLQNGAQAVEDVVHRNLSLARSRELRSRHGFNELMRHLSQEVFEALCDATTCKCSRRHRMCLELVPRDKLLRPSEDDDQVAPECNFHVIFNTKVTGTNGHLDEQGGGSSTQPFQLRWESLQIRAVRSQETSPATSVPPILSLGQAQTHNPPNVTLGTGTLSTATTTLTQAATLQLPLSTEPVHIDDLCHLVSKRGKMRARSCCGYIRKGDRTFGIHDQDEGLQLDTSTTLPQTFESQDQRLAFMEKIHLALALSAGTLHQHDTEWMVAPLALEDVVLLQRKPPSPTQTHGTSLRRPFLARTVERAASKPSSTTDHQAFAGPVNLAVLALGSMLAQIAIGERDDKLTVPSAPDPPTIAAIYHRLEERSSDVLKSGGSDYKLAVDWCHDNVYQIATLANHEKAHDFHMHVVKGLQANLDLLRRRGTW